MKKILVVLAMLIAVTLVTGTANAALLGIREIVGASYPDILLNTDGAVTYNATTNLFTFTAHDQKITYAPGDFENMTAYVAGYVDISTKSTITVTIDENGDLVGTGWMIEQVEHDSDPYTLKGNAFVANDIVLEGPVSVFGWGEGTGGEQLGTFAFKLDSASLSGKLIDYGIWPTEGETGIFAFSEGTVSWDGLWTHNFSLTKVKADKAPLLVPEPASLLLLGSGLMGLAAVGRKKKKIA